MSQLNVDNIRNRTGSNGGPNFPSGITVAVGQTAYIHGNLQVDGTETIINTETLNVSDKTVGIGSTSNASNTTADGAGIEIFASSSQTGNNKTLKWLDSTDRWTFAGGDVSANAYYGDGSNLTGIDATAIQTGNTSVQTVDTGSDGHVKMTTEGGERVRIGPAGQIGLGGANYGTSGQMLTSGGSGSAPTWTTVSSAPEITGTASGAIAADKSCIVNADGTISEVEQTIVPSTTTKVDTELSSNNTYRTQDVTWINDDKFIITGRKMNDSNRVRYIFGSVDANGAITLGTPYGLITGDPTDCWNPKVAVDRSTGKIMVVIQNNNVNYTAVRGGVINGAGNDIDWGAVMNINANGSGQRSCAIASDNNGGFMIACRNANHDMKFRHAQLDSNNDVDLSNDASWTYYNTGNGATANGENKACMEYIPSVGAYWYVTEDSNRFYYSPNGIWLAAGGFLRACWAKSNGTGSSPTMTQANQTPFTGPSANTDPGSAGQLGYEPGLSYDSVTGKGILSYRRAFSGGKPMGAVLTFTDTSAQPTYTAATELSQDGAAGFQHSWNTKMKEAICYFATSSPSNTQIKGFTISGNGLVDANHNLNVFAGVDNQYLDVASNPNKNRVITATQDEDSGNYISASTVDIPFTATNITAENFIGFAAASYADTATATIKIVGNTTTQSGLTPGQKYYVTNTGALSLTADTPSVEAGTAISSTKIIVKG